MGSQLDLCVREAADSDRDAVLAVMLDAYGEYAGQMAADRWQQYREAIVQSVQGPGPVARIVAELAGQIVGSVQLFVSSEAAYGRPELEIDTPIIRYLSVSPRARGRGIATLLIKESVRRSLALGSATLHLHTSDMMAPAIRLYERLGFERAPDKEFYNGDILVKSYRLHLQGPSFFTAF
ncbi:GNAT family N-acetyltransferase [Paenibacillus lutrae]|uniref:GNAT family N-acetyltransferase n=1 Tax=Paenibacillus lutrae TaxID=2078573 RepID=A0A7X3K1S6_9BACL|nr:GNAT family N-acetyltransferase [Paenibacillus lutrae]MVP02437.1 GNAT family N-acetyltransferase [Paenibacillus lutrae]